MKRIGGTALLACWASLGCVHTGFVPTSNISPPARPEHCALDVILDGRPDRQYLVIGRVSADGTAPSLFALRENQEAALRRLKAKACAEGAHVIFDVDATSSGQWNDDGFSRSTTASALAAVYVDQEGYPLPPPGLPVGDH
jgi:hypothetical protein